MIGVRERRLSVEEIEGFKRQFSSLSHSTGAMCINRNMYSIEQAKAIFQENMGRLPKEVLERDMVYGYGTDINGDRYWKKWWIDWKGNMDGEKRCPVWIMI